MEMESHVELVNKFSSFKLPEWGAFAFINKTDVQEIQRFYCPTTPNSFEFEKNFPLLEVTDFMYSNWSLAFGIGVAYLAISFGLQEFMKERKPVNLKWSLFFWNLIVGLFSLAGFLRSIPELRKFVGREHGFYESICIPNYTDTSAFISLMFCLSKIPELVDTLFVVLKKRPLEPVQWYHHVVTMFGCWICTPYMEPVARYVITINFGVHSLMYPYFALKAIGVKVPRQVAKTITTCQFAQMLFSLVVNILSAYYYLSGTRYCHRHPVSLIYLLIANVVFVAMFGKLFANLVLKPSKPQAKKISSEKTE